jgi:hypothetical protein
LRRFHSKFRAFRNFQTRLTLVDNELPPVKTRSQQQLDAVRESIPSSASDDELSAEDYAELESGKYKLDFRTCLKTGFQREITAVSFEISRSKEFSNTP